MKFASRFSAAPVPAAKFAASVPPSRSGRTVLPTAPQLAALPMEVSDPPFAVQFSAAGAPVVGARGVAPPTHTRPPPTIQSTGV